MPPAAMASSVRSAMGCRVPASVRPRRARRRHSSTRVGRGNLGAGPKPPHSGSKPAAQSVDHAARCSRRRDRVSAPGAGRPARPARRVVRSERRLGQAQLLAHGVDEGVGLCQDLVPLVVPRLAQRLDDPAERGHAVSLLRREVGAGVEGAAVRRAEDGHGPAARPGQGLGGRHVDGVEVGPLLPVHLDRDEPLGQVGGRRGVLEALVGHDVAPVARGVADGEEDRLVLVRGPGAGPRHPRGTTPPDCRRAGGGRGWSRRPGGSRQAMLWRHPGEGRCAVRARLGNGARTQGTRPRSITGGSRGIGLAIASRFAEAGANVMLSVADGRGPGRGGGRPGRAGCAAGQGGLGRRPMSAIPRTRKSCVADTVARFGGLDILVNNAGHQPLLRPDDRHRRGPGAEDVRGQPAVRADVDRCAR